MPKHHTWWTVRGGFWGPRTFYTETEALEYFEEIKNDDWSGLEITIEKSEVVKALTRTRKAGVNS